MRITIPRLLLAVLAVSLAADVGAAQKTSKKTKKTQGVRLFRILNRNSGKVATIPAFNDKDGAIAVQAAAKDGDQKQLWAMIGGARGWFRIANKRSGKYLSVKDNAKANGAAVVQWSASRNVRAQMWRMLPVPRRRGWFYLKNQAGGKVLGVLSGSKSDGGQLVVWDYTRGAENQHWKFQFLDGGRIAKSTPGKKPSTGKTGKTPSGKTATPGKLPTGYVKIVNRNSGKVLGVLSRSTANGGIVVQWQFVSGEPNQHWKLVSAGKGAVTILNKNSGKLLTPKGRAKKQSSHVIQWSAGDGATDQQWKLVAADAGKTWYRLINVATGYALAVSQARKNNGAAILHVAVDPQAPEQLWKFEAIE